jgi:hypothetical protein
LNAEHWRALKEAAPQAEKLGIKASVRGALPALFDGDGLVAAPHFDYRRKGWSGSVNVRFAPAQGLT